MKKIAVFLATLATMILMTGCGGKTINANDYITIEFKGYDGYGTAEVIFDSAQFRDDCSKLKIAKGAKDDGIPLEMVFDDASDYLRACISGSLEFEDGSGNGKLKNGDTVTYVIKLYDENTKKNAGATLKGKNIQVKVSGLDEVNTFDAFATVNVLFSGIAPNGEASVESSSGLSYDIDKRDGLKNGDTVTVTVRNVDNVPYMIENYGGIPESLTKEYTVSGLNAYIKSADEIDAATMNKMEQQARDEISSYVASQWDDPSDLHNVELLGYYFLTPKESNTRYGRMENGIDLIFKITALEHTPDAEGNDFDFYWYGHFENIMILTDGTVSVDLSRSGNPNKDWGGSFAHGQRTVWPYVTFYYSGYENLDSLFNNRVAVNVADYDYISTVE